MLSTKHTDTDSADNLGMSSSTFGERLKECRRAIKMTQPQVAKRVGMSQTNLSELENNKYPTSSFTPALASLYGVEAMWLSEGRLPKYRGDKEPHSRTDTTHFGNVESATLRGEVKLISWIQAGQWAGAVDNYAPGDGETTVPTTVPVKRHTYALRVKGDSMTNPYGWPSFPEGMIIIVEPEMDFLPNDFVIIKNGDDEATFKQLVKDGSAYYMKPLNPRYPILPLPEDAVFCGVVRGYGGLIR